MAGPRAPTGWLPGPSKAPKLYTLGSCLPRGALASPQTPSRLGMELGADLRPLSPQGLCTTMARAVLLTFDVSNSSFLSDVCFLQEDFSGPRDWAW